MQPLTLLPWLQASHPQDTVVAEDSTHHEDPGQVQHQARHVRTRRHGACDQEEERFWEIDLALPHETKLVKPTQPAKVAAAVQDVFFMKETLCCSVLLLTPQNLHTEEKI